MCFVSEHREEFLSMAHAHFVQLIINSLMR